MTQRHNACKVLSTQWAFANRKIFFAGFKTGSWRGGWVGESQGYSEACALPLNTVREAEDSLFQEHLGKKWPQLVW